MYDESLSLKPPRMVAIIPARGGSTGIPRKNIREFLGKPLLAWTIEVALESAVFERVILSTEDEEIAKVGRAHGVEVPFLRPKELAEDTTPTAPVARHAVEWLRAQSGWIPEFVMVLEPTSPTRRAFHLREVAGLLLTGGADSVASVCELPHHYNPVKVLRLCNDASILGIVGTPVREMIHRRQDLPSYYAFDGLVFSCRTELILADPPTLWGNRVSGYIVHPRYRVDLDAPEDWAPAEVRFRHILLEEGR